MYTHIYCVLCIRICTLLVGFRKFRLNNTFYFNFYSEPRHRTVLAPSCWHVWQEGGVHLCVHGRPWSHRAPCWAATGIPAPL